AEIRLPLLERELARELLAALLDEVGDRVADLGSLPCRERGPLRLRLARGRHRTVDVGRARIRRLRDHLARGRRDDLADVLARRGGPAAADEVLERPHRHGHRWILRSEDRVEVIRGNLERERVGAVGRPGAARAERPGERAPERAGEDAPDPRGQRAERLPPMRRCFLLDDHLSGLAPRRAAPDGNRLVALPEGHEREPKRAERRLRPIVRDVGAEVVEARLVEAHPERVVADSIPDDEAYSGLPHPVEALCHPARLELLRHALRIGRVAIPAELGDPEADPLVRDDPPVAARCVEECPHLVEIAERHVVTASRVVRRAAGRVRVVRPDVEGDLRAARRAARGAVPHAQDLPHEVERPDRRLRRERRRTAGDHRIVRVHRVDGGREVVRQGAVPARRALLEHAAAHVRLVPGLPVPDARQILEGAAVTLCGGGRELPEADRIGPGDAARVLLASPVRRPDHDHDRLELVLHGKLELVVERAPVVAGVGGVGRLELLRPDTRIRLRRDAAPVEREPREGGAGGTDVAEGDVGGRRDEAGRVHHPRLDRTRRRARRPRRPGGREEARKPDCSGCRYSVRRIPDSRVRRCAIVTGTMVTSRTTKTTTLTSGSCWPRRMLPKIHRGSVFCAPAVNVVTITSSKESANASSAPETSAVEIDGSVTYLKVWNPSAPRSIDASVSDPGTRRSRATTLLKTITVQNVACPTTIVQRPKFSFQNVKKELKAIPVMIPGSAIGSTNTNEIASRPKKRALCRANAAAVPSTSATSVARAPAFSERISVCCISPSWIAGPNHFVVQSVIGQPWTFEALKA